MTQSPYTQYTLANGLHVVIERMPDVRSAAAGFLVRTGARDEVASLAGISHFLEHMIFKGTAKRTWRDITIGFDAMGSTYNAFTSEDRTVFYGWVRHADLDTQLELLADMMRSALPPQEFETEKQVILEEIAMSKDSLEHVAFDFLQEKVFADHPLAWPILGYEATIAPLSRDTLWDYFQKRYAPNNMVLFVAGNVDPTEAIRLADRYCGSWTTAPTPPPRTPPVIHSGTGVLAVDRFKQQVLAMSFPSLDACNPRAETAEAAAAILGGHNSRFYWNIVQKGLASRAGAFHLDYTDCGLMILYAICPPDNVEAVHEAMTTEAKRMGAEGVEQREIERVKNARRTALAVESEVPYHRLTQLIDDVEYRGAPRTVEQMLADVEAITVDSVFEYFQQCPIHTNGFLTSVGPRQWS